jgi:hypothetical protein
MHGATPFMHNCSIPFETHPFLDLSDRRRFFLNRS